MATFLSRTASYAALQRSKNNPGLKTEESLEFLPTELILYIYIIILLRYSLLTSQINKAVNKDIEAWTDC